MSNVITAPLPATSQLWTKFTDGDFIDGYAVDSSLSAADAVEVGLTMPAWAIWLLALRNRIVAPLGLKTEVSNASTVGIFPIQFEDSTEMIVGTDDAHLNFRIAVLRQEGRIHMATWVHRNNWLGRVYLMAVMPFHILIVRDAMKRIAKASTPIASMPSAQ